MRIVYGHVFDVNGEKLGEEFIDTSQPEVLGMFEAWAAAGGPPDSSGWNEPSTHPDYKGETKYAALLAEVARLEDKPAIQALAVKRVRPKSKG